MKAYKPLITSLSKSPVKKFEYKSNTIQLITKGMSGGESWTDLTTDSTYASSAEQLTNRTKLLIEDRDSASGIVWEAGGAIIGTICYIHGGTLYVNACDGSEITSDDSINLEYTIPRNGEFTLEAVLTPLESALYIDGVEVDRDTSSGRNDVSGGDVGGIKQGYSTVAENLGGFDANTPLFNETILECHMWKNKIPEGWS